VAYWAPWTGVLACGDYLSPVELPMLSGGGSLAAYRETLIRLRVLVEQATWVIPGHGSPLEREPALKVLEEDSAYLQQLAADPPASALPRSRSGAAQKRIHEANLARLQA
jgi:glyoxylase-like metal-dependent hydrolase (beta-lactamase superfamily II)